MKGGRKSLCYVPSSLAYDRSRRLVALAAVSHLVTLVGAVHPCDAEQGTACPMEADLFSRGLFSFFAPSLAAPLPPLLSVACRPFLPLENCSIL